MKYTVEFNARITVEAETEEQAIYKATFMLNDNDVTVILSYDNKCDDCGRTFLECGC